MTNDEILSFMMSEMGRVPSRNSKLHETCETIIKECAGKVVIDPLLIMALIYIESSYNPKAVSGVGAHGLMQLMPRTAVELAHNQGIPYAGPDDLYDPVLNVTLGIRYLGQLFTEFHGNLVAALTAYNRGPGNTHKIIARFNSLPSHVVDMYAGLILRKYYDFVRQAPLTITTV